MVPVRLLPEGQSACISVYVEAWSQFENLSDISPCLVDLTKLRDACGHMRMREVLGLATLLKARAASAYLRAACSTIKDFT